MRVDFKECPVPILQDEWEFSILLDVYFEICPREVLEIGSFFGGTLWYWIQMSREFCHLRKLTSIDLPITYKDPRFNKMTECKNKWSSWIYDTNIEFKDIEGDSRDERIIDQVSGIFDNKLVDFLFIDGGHDEDTVHADYINYSQLVRKDGIIVFHDIICEPGVANIWKKIRYKKRTVEINNEYGIGILYKD